jgi:hypothetical protein
MLAGMKKQVMSGGEADGVVASGSGTARSNHACRTPSLSPSPSHFPTGKGKKRVHFDEEYTTVYFGPVTMAGDPQDIFTPLFKGLLKVVRRNVLVEPALVEEHDRDHLAIRFHSLVDANNFAMTWMFHRFEPYAHVSAVLRGEE